MNEPGTHDAKWKQPGAKDNSLWSHLCQPSRIGKSTETESRFVVPGGRRGTEGGEDMTALCEWGLLLG